MLFIILKELKFHSRWGLKSLLASNSSSSNSRMSSNSWKVIATWGTCCYSKQRHARNQIVTVLSTKYVYILFSQLKKHAWHWCYSLIIPIVNSLAGSIWNCQLIANERHFENPTILIKFLNILYLKWWYFAVFLFSNK